MNDGYIKVAAVTPYVTVADPAANGARIRSLMKETAEEGAQAVVFPELCLTGFTCGDLFLQQSLLDGAKEELWRIAEESRGLDGIFFVGLPFAVDGKLYNVAAAISGGRILGMVPKTHIPNYAEFYELRYFASGAGLCRIWEEGDQSFLIGTRQLFSPENGQNLLIAAEICEDLWAPNPPSAAHALRGADLIVNLSASDEVTGKSSYRRDLVRGASARLLCAYMYVSSGEGESTQDVVYSGHDIIAENGHILAESPPFAKTPDEPDAQVLLYAQVDIEGLTAQRLRMNTFSAATDPELPEMRYRRVGFSLEEKQMPITRRIDPHPFVPEEQKSRSRRCEEILSIQTQGLMKRLFHTNCAHPVIGISGGLDSTLALLVTVRALDALGRSRSDLTAVTMPGFGTTGQTYDCACRLVHSVGATLTEIPIAEAVTLHFRDIGQDPNVYDTAYENSQARERTQILMDIANRLGGLVIGTGDMSELALGWATYNGDHMSMYAVNSGVPKTLVRHLVRFIADSCGDDMLSEVLGEILDAPVTPELLPPKDGQISQKTESLVGPYELHDFFLYYLMRYGFSPKKIYRLAQSAFSSVYSDEEILKWEKVFYRRFFSQQFKRSCLPDGPKVGTVSLSPRGDLRMPSDACARAWTQELNDLDGRG